MSLINLSEWNSTRNLAINSIVYLLLFIVAILVQTRAWSGFLRLLNGAEIKANYLRAIKVIVCFMLLSVAFLIVSAIIYGMIAAKTASVGTSFATITAIYALTTLVLLVIFALIVSPLIYSFTKYLLNPLEKFRDAVSVNYRKGCRYTGFAFTIIVILSLISLIIAMFLAVPAYVTTIADNIDKLGVLNGDASGLPSYFKLLSFLSSGIMNFVLSYVNIWILTVLCYAYGNIEHSINQNNEIIEKQ